MEKQTNKKTTITTRMEKKEKLTLPIFNLNGKGESGFTLPKVIFKNDGKKEVLAQYVRVYLSNQKPKTGATKTRSEVTGSTRKIYRQKGTGRARHGSIKAPIFVGGGIAHGPKPRHLSLKLNKKQKRKTLFLALSLAFKENKIVILSDEVLQIKPKTNLMVKLLQNFSQDKNPTFLLVLPVKEKNNLLIASKNIPYLKVIDVANLNPYLVLQYKKILFLENAIDKLAKIYWQKNDEN
jgi:large subunit ribosomal protein L4